MSFAWLDDDDSVVGPTAPKSSSSAVYKSEDVVFYCGNCRSTNSYVDDSSGLRVCSDCFSQIQQSQQEGTEFEEFDQLGARSRYGFTKRRHTAGGRKSYFRKDLELDANRARKIPSLAQCFQGIRYILEGCTKILQEEILPGLPNQQPIFYHLSEDDTSRLRHSVRHFWLAYLRAWSDGSQHYGTIFPHTRFAMIDCFLARPYNIFRTLMEEGKTKLKAALKRKENANNQTTPKTVTFSLDHKDHDDGTPTGDNPYQPDDPEEFNEVEDSDDDDSLADYSVKRCQVPHSGVTSFRILVQEHVRATETPVDYKTAAIFLKPGMELVATILLMALLANNVVIPTFEFLRWIETDKLPLRKAFERFVPAALQSKLGAVARAFHYQNRMDSTTMDGRVLHLAIACRIRSEAVLRVQRASPGVRIPYRYVLHWNGPHTLALRMAQLAAAAGLPRSVLDRGLILVGLTPTTNVKTAADDEDALSVSDNGSVDSSMDGSTTKESGPGEDGQSLETDMTGANTIKNIPQIAWSKDVTCPEEIMAILAIACQLDPHWRDWKYYKAGDQNFVLPRNLTEAMKLDDPTRYLRLCYKETFEPLYDMNYVMPPQDYLFEETARKKRRKREVGDDATIGSQSIVTIATITASLRSGRDDDAQSASVSVRSNQSARTTASGSVVSSRSNRSTVNPAGAPPVDTIATSHSDKSVVSSNNRSVASSTRDDSRSVRTGRSNSSSSALEGDNSSDESSDDGGWGLTSLKPSSVLRHQDILRGVSPPPLPPEFDYSQYNLAKQWDSVQEYPLGDDFVVELLEHLSYSADLSTIHGIQAAMRYYLPRQTRTPTTYVDGRTVTAQAKQRRKQKTPAKQSPNAMY